MSVAFGTIADGAGSATNTSRPLTHSSELSREGLAVDATHEEWRPVVGFEDTYEVSDQGRVRSAGPNYLSVFSMGDSPTSSHGDGYCNRAARKADT